MVGALEMVDQDSNTDAQHNHQGQYHADQDVNDPPELQDDLIGIFPLDRSGIDLLGTLGNGDGGPGFDDRKPDWPPFPCRISCTASAFPP